MKVRIAVGNVALVVEGVDYTRRQVVNLLGHVAGVALAIAGEDDKDAEERPPIGFTTITEIAAPMPEEAVEGDDDE